MLSLLVPSLIETVVDTDVAHLISFLQLHIPDVGDGGERKVFFQFYGNPVCGSFVGIFYRLFQCVSCGITTLQIREKRSVGVIFGFYEKRLDR